MRIFFLINIVSAWLFLFGCSGEDQFITDNNICPTSPSQEVSDTTDYSSVVDLDITGLGSSYGQVVTFDPSKKYWGIKLRLKTQLLSTDKVKLKFFEENQKVVTARISAIKVKNSYDWFLARFNNIRSFIGRVYFSLSSDSQSLQDMSWSSGSGSGLLESDLAGAVWSEFDNQGGHYRLLPCL
tara:strand:+ start:62 stop:610 length:549 start_codon:yes stop_codon:yes gene_type:complete